MATTGKSLRDLYPNRRDVPFLLVLSFGVLIAGLSLPLITVEKNLFWRQRMKTLHWLGVLGKWSMLTTMRITHLARKARAA